MKIKNTNVAYFRIRILGLLLLIFVLTAGNCTQPLTLFKSNFDTTAGSPPTPAQATGTASVSSAPGNVVVAAIPNAPGIKAVRVKRPAGPDVSIFHGKFSEEKGPGNYTFSASVYIPAGAGIASIQFGTFNQAADDIPGFLHIDFHPDGRVIFDDVDGTAFGTFPHDQLFIVQVKLAISANDPPKATVLLSGAGASGQSERIITPAPLQDKARHFGSIKIFVGFPNVAEFYATNIVVTKA